jgi:flavodoxin
MKILITYYSKTGNTKRVAEDLAKNLKADIDEIIDLTDRSGIKGWFLAGRDAMKEYLTEIKTSKNPKDYDLVIIGTPVWAWNTTPAARTYVTKFKNQFRKVAFFIISDDTKPEVPVGFLEKVMDKKAVSYAGWMRMEMKNEKNYQKRLEEFVANINKITS